MTKALALSTLFLAATAGVAAADAAPATSGGGDSPVAGSVGIGAEYQLTSIASGLGNAGGISAIYDAGLFHVGGFVSYTDPAGPNNTSFGIGGEFYYHIHHTSMADFSLGGSLGIITADAPDAAGGSTSTTAVVLEPSFQVRWFATSNFALSFTGGFSIGLTSDDKNFGVGAIDAIAGFHYYFTK